MTAYIFDTETTRLIEPEIVEAAWLAFATVDDVIPRQIAPANSLRNYWERFKPSKAMQFSAIATHHILPEDLVDCPPTSSFMLPAAAQYLAGHNIDFDWKAIGSPPLKRICTLAIARHVWPEADGYSIAALIYLLNGATRATRDLLRGAHNAFADCALAATVLEAILTLKPEITTWSALHAYSEFCRIPIVMGFGKHEGVKLGELPADYITWCLRQCWLDEYLRIGLERVMAERRGVRRA